MRILFLGDIVGRAGRMAIKQYLPRLKTELALDVVIANAENAAGGIGMDCRTADEIFSLGVDFLTSGNHVWRIREIFPRLDKDNRMIRPANYPEGAPGRGHTVFMLKDGRKLAVLNLLGLTYMEPLDCPFRTANRWADELEAEKGSLKEKDNTDGTGNASRQELEGVPIRIVDFHAEATSEKKVLGWYLDGRVSAVIGTHTHVQTADAQILPKGTAYITDAGMCGVEQSSLGMDFELVLKRFTTHLPMPFKPAHGEISLNGVFLDIDDASGLAREIRPIRENCPTFIRSSV